MLNNISNILHVRQKAAADNERDLHAFLTWAWARVYYLRAKAQRRADGRHRRTAVWRRASSGSQARAALGRMEGVAFPWDICFNPHQ